MEQTGGIIQSLSSHAHIKLPDQLSRWGNTIKSFKVNTKTLTSILKWTESQWEESKTEVMCSREC